MSQMPRIGGNMQRDFSLHGASRDTLQKQLSYAKVLEQFQQVTYDRQAISRRREIAKDIKDNWSHYP